MFNNLIIHAQSYQYFAKLAAFPVILAWAITILACIVVGKSFLFQLASS